MPAGSAVHVVDRRACAGRGLSQKGAGDRNDRKRRNLSQGQGRADAVIGTCEAV